MRTRTLALVSALVLISSVANANFIKFYNGGDGYGGPFSGPGTVYADTKGLITNCPAWIFLCGQQDVIQKKQSYLGTDLTATADQLVWDDLVRNFAGLGVGTGRNLDNINGGDRLTLSFAAPVTVAGIGTLFSPLHGPFGRGHPAASSFLLSVDGGAFEPVSFAAANDEQLNLIGTTFAFEQDRGNSFYVSGLQVEEIPGPELGTGLPAALALFGLLCLWLSKKMI